MRYLLMPLAVVFVVPPLAAEDKPEPTPTFTAKCSKKDDKFESSADKGAAVWKITTPSGISGATVELKSGPAPKKIVIRFAGFRSLEYFGLESGDLKLRSQLDRKGKNVVSFDDKGKTGADPKTAAGSLSVESEKDGVVVVL